MRFLKRWKAVLIGFVIGQMVYWFILYPLLKAWGW